MVEGCRVEMRVEFILCRRHVHQGIEIEIRVRYSVTRTLAKQNNTYTWHIHKFYNNTTSGTVHVPLGTQHSCTRYMYRDTCTGTQIPGYIEY